MRKGTLSVASTTPTREKVVLAATILGSSMAFIDGTVVNVALAALQTGLHASLADVQWVVDAYMLVLAALLLIGGSLGDIYGRRKIYAIGVTIFAAASAACGLAPDVRALIAARSVQGLGAALLIPGSLALITATFPVARRGRAIGTWSGATAVTTAIGPVLGGWLIEHASWRWVFFLNLPLAVAVLVLCIYVPESKGGDSPRGLDWTGAALAAVGLGAVTYALIEWPNRSAAAGVRLAVIGAVGVASIAAFVAYEHRCTAPMIPPALFRSRNFTGANVLTLLLYAALSGLMFFLPMNLIEIQHYTATEAGAAFLPFIVIMFSLSRWAGGLVERYGARVPLVAGPLITACGLALFAMAPEGRSYWRAFFPAMAVMGFGMTICVAPLTTTVMNSVPETESGLASGVNNAVSRIASLLAVAVLGAILAGGFNRALDRRLPALGLSAETVAEVNAGRAQLAAMPVTDAGARSAVAGAFLSGYRTMTWITAGFAVLGSLIAFVMIEPRKVAAAVEKVRADGGVTTD
jgi:EmrB/QacA subfamily drug resistance transporter